MTIDLRLDYDHALKWLRDGQVTWDRAMAWRDDPDSRLDEAALRDYLREAPKEFEFRDARRHNKGR